MKRTYKNIIALAMTSGMLIFQSCTKNFEEINDDPNNPADVPTSYLLTGAEKGLMDAIWDSFWGAQVGGQLAQHWSSNQYTSESRYEFRTGVTSDKWSDMYGGGTNEALFIVGGLMELQSVIEQCSNEPDKTAPYGDPNNQIAVAKILKSWAIQMMTDTWGNIPYSEALKGTENPQPAYDNQRDIYFGLLADVNDALSKINDGDGPIGDVIYGGDMTQWKKFANSLKLRIAMRMSDRESSAASTAINEAIASGIFESNADNALFPYTSSSPNFSLYYYNYALDNRNDYCASNTMVDVMNTLTDARLGSFYNVAQNSGTFVGEVYGLSEANGASTLDQDISQRSDRILAADFPGIYMDYAETQFILAEAVERGYIAGDAESFYNNGITASFNFWEAGDASAYIAQPNVDYSTLIGAGSTWKQVIGKQKWIALYMQGIQGWSEYRRLDFGILQLPADGPLSGSGIPNRLPYPVDEQTLNAASYSGAIASQGADALETKVWWDMN
ncbi:MAG: SusD/RagB family nutrient-binding outer membrane lipoprotein [Flavobacteriales bacterium]